MEFSNLTPFSALCFSALDPHDREYHVVVMRVCYELRPSVPGWLYASLIEDEPPPLVMADCYSGDEGRSSVLCESDLAPFKPRCDVIVTGSAHAPEGRPAARWPTRLRVSRPERPNDLPAGRSAAPQGAQRMHVLLDKQLVVHGPRQFRRTWRGSWELEQALPVSTVPLSYERAFGGASVVRAPNNDSTLAPLLNEVCYQNPLGCGWRHAEESKILDHIGAPVPDLVSAPQIEYPDDPIQDLCVMQQPRGPLSPLQMLQVTQAEAHRPAGFGVIGRAWTPRLQRAGSYDDAWLRDRWPGLPGDFDFGYWNGAPADQQIAYPPPDLFIELTNLIDPMLACGGHFKIQLPGHRAYALARFTNGTPVPMRCVIDTLHIDAEALRVACVWRVVIPRDWPLGAIEARFELDPRAPLPRFSSMDRQQEQEAIHG